MEVSEDLDLESLMELLDEDSEPNKMEVKNQYLPKKLDRAEVDESFTDHSLKKTEPKILKDISLDFMEVTNQYLPKELDRADNEVDHSLQKVKPKFLKDIPLDFVQPVVPKSSGNISLSASFKSSLIHSGEADSSDDENKTDLTDTGKDIKKKISEKINHYFDKNRRVIKTWKDKSESKLPMNKASADTSSIDKYSGIRIIKPLVPFDVLQQKMQGRRMIKMSFIKNCIKGGDIEGDWVTMGVIIQKVPPKTAKNGKMFSIWKMTDLLDCEKIVSVFLFGAAHAEHWKTAVGTVVGILNPSIIPGRDTNEVLSLSVDHAGKFMIMGTSKDFGHCKARRKDGETCRIIVNMAQCEYCVYHVKKEFKKFSSNRSELQTSYSGREPSFKNKILKGQNFFYGGQMFTAPA
ncbi:protein MCM10 homolog, partial [Stegodyphus dumicola]|uniref:protein MCM10 homolog n=1 Tax=Stegodyphus dumicola TaxID=202533 RepID=UPI0015AE1223